MKTNIRDTLQRWGLLFLISCVSLFLELAVIRWISGEIRLLSYFKNLVLLAAFLGLAIGFALVGKGRDYKGAFPWLWLLFVALVLATGKATQNRMLVFPGGGDEALWNTVNLSFWYSLLIFIALVCIFFFSILFLFIPLGQATGEEMEKHLPIPSYIVNIIASLVGVWLFSLLSYLNTPPIVWFTCGLIGFGLYFAFYRKLKWSIGVTLLLTLIGIGIIEPKTI